MAEDEKYFHILKTCQFIEKSSQSDVHYQVQYWYNGLLQAFYNSSTEKVVGFTHYGKVFADEVNKSPDYLKVRRNDLNYYCKVLGAVLYKNIQVKAGKQQRGGATSGHIRPPTLFLFDLTKLLTADRGK